MLYADALLRCCQMADTDMQHVKVHDEHMNQMPLHVNKVSLLPGRAMIAVSPGSQICFGRFYIHGRAQKANVSEVYERRPRAVRQWKNFHVRV